MRFARRTSLKRHLTAIVMIGILLTQSLGILYAAPAPFETIDLAGLTISYEVPLKGAAEDLAAVFPAVVAELETLFGWCLSQRPTVMLIQTGEVFRRRADHPLILAYAVPSESLIVIDFGKLAGRPAHFRSVLKHEAAHLFLHAGLGEAVLPKWLEEGVAQWASEGVAELLVQPQSSLLEDAIVSGTLMPLSDLHDRFPTDPRKLLLAYAQSRRAVSFIVAAHGPVALVEILADIRRGGDVDVAFQRVLKALPREIERRWIAHENQDSAWLAFLAGHLYHFLFLLAALLTLAGFVRFRLQKRDYADREGDEDQNENII